MILACMLHAGQVVSHLFLPMLSLSGISSTSSIVHFGICSKDSSLRFRLPFLTFSGHIFLFTVRAKQFPGLTVKFSCLTVCFFTIVSSSFLSFSCGLGPLSRWLPATPYPYRDFIAHSSYLCSKIQNDHFCHTPSSLRAGPLRPNGWKNFHCCQVLCNSLQVIQLVRCQRNSARKSGIGL